MRTVCTLASLLCFACGGAAPPEVAAPPVTASAPAATADVTRECYPSAGSLPPFVAPTGGDAFRHAVLARAPELRCCTDDEPHVVVTFLPDMDLDRARARLAEPASLDALSAACLERMLATWIVVPAPRGDVCRPSLNPLGPACTFSTASVTVALPL